MQKIACLSCSVQLQQKQRMTKHKHTFRVKINGVSKIIFKVRSYLKGDYKKKGSDQIQSTKDELVEFSQAF